MAVVNVRLLTCRVAAPVSSLLSATVTLADGSEPSLTWKVSVLLPSATVSGMPVRIRARTSSSSTVTDTVSFARSL